MTSRARRLSLIACACLAVVGGAAAWLAREQWPKHLRLLREGTPTTGVVTAKGLGGGEAVNYSYWVDGSLHSGIGRAGFGTASFDKLEVDDNVLVVYSKKDPDVSTLGDPKEHMRGQNRLIALGLILALPVLYWALARELKSAGWEHVRVT